MGQDNGHRAERHLGKTNAKGQAFNPEHNDRNFDLSLAKHIDQTRTKNNIYYNVEIGREYTHQEKIENNISNFLEVETTFYRTHFSDGLNAKNDRYLKQRHKNKCQTMDEYYRNPKTCPFEAHYQLGNINHQIDEKLYDTIMREQLEWEKKTFPNIVILDYATHKDETVLGTHVRYVPIGYDKDNNLVVNQNSAFEYMRKRHEYELRRKFRKQGMSEEDIEKNLHDGY